MADVVSHAPSRLKRIGEHLWGAKGEPGVRPVMRNEPIHTERPMRIIVVGAGASGTLFAYKLQRSFQKFELQIYEKNKEISGTWYENRYPGCACDVPSHTYCWSFEPKVDWSSVYSGSREIYKYFNDFADKYDLRRYIKCEHEVNYARWDGLGYEVRILDKKSGKTFTDHCDILINAAGILNAWRWPAIPGLKSYKGPLLHSAAWNESLDLTGKHVGLIGNGSSGIQILPAIYDKVSHITTFIREPTWVSPVMGLDQHVFSEDEKATFRNDPEALLEYRRSIERGLNGAFPLFVRETQLQKDTFEGMKEAMKGKLGNAFLEEKLIPEWDVGCRRLTPGINYLESLVKPKTTVIYGEIAEIKPEGPLCDNGQTYPVDVLICATGFDTSFKPRFPILGFNNLNLQDDWAVEPRSYLGLAAANFPNYFQFLGPNCPIGNGPVLASVEYQADYMLKFLDRWQTERIKSFAPKKAAVDDFIAYKDQYMKRTVWDRECRSWYKNNMADGKITALWPGSAVQYIECISNVRYDDWDIEYLGNRFDYLGDGTSQAENDKTCELGWYIRDEDDGPLLSKEAARKILTKSGTRSPDAGDYNLVGSSASKAAAVAAHTVAASTT